MTREREPTDAERKMPLLDRPPETLSTAEKNLISSIVETQTKYNRRISSTPAAQQVISENPELKSAVEKNTEARFKEATKDRDIEVKVEQTQTERGTQEISKYYDVKTGQLIAQRTQTELNVWVDSQGKRTSPTLQQITGTAKTNIPQKEEIKTQQNEPIRDILSPRTSGQKKTEQEALIISAVLNPEKQKNAMAPILSSGVEQKAPDSFFFERQNDRRPKNSDAFR
jgi:hypothetical protein